MFHGFQDLQMKLPRISCYFIYKKNHSQIFSELTDFQMHGNSFTKAQTWCIKLNYWSQNDIGLQT